MISANVIKGVHELLEDRGIRPESAETFEDTVARALGITRHQTEILLEALHDGATVDQAATAAKIESPTHERDLLIRILNTCL